MTPEEEKDFLLDHVRHPRNVGEIDSPLGTGECKNPVCGDHVRVSLNDLDSIEIKIRPAGCTICVASASLMSEVVKNKTIADVRDLIQLMRDSMRPGTEWPQKLELLSPLKRMKESPMKIPCTLVGWLALERACDEALKNG